MSSSLYTLTKKDDKKFSKVLQLENSLKLILILTIITFYIKTLMTGVRDSAPGPGPAAGQLPPDPEGGGEGGGAQLGPGLPHSRAGGPQQVLEIRGRPHYTHLQ